MIELIVLLKKIEDLGVLKRNRKNALVDIGAFFIDSNQNYIPTDRYNYMFKVESYQTGGFPNIEKFNIYIKDEKYIDELCQMVKISILIKKR